MSRAIEILKDKYTNSLGLPFQKILPEQMITSILEEENIKYRNRLFNPIVTLWAFLSQVLEENKSLNNALSRIIAWLAEKGEKIPAADTGGYAKARQRLPENFLLNLWRKTGTILEEQVKPEDLWCGRRVKLCDGSTVLMSDTEKNQEAYPQQTNQSDGCGFPLAKIVVIFSLATGGLLELAIATWKTGEVTLARQLYQSIFPGDILLADRAFGTYVDLALIQSQRADGVFRKHQSRKSDFRRGKKLGIGDHYVTWFKPKRCPNGMTAEEYALLPEQIQVREVHLLIQQKGFRPREIIIVTTLLDSQTYTKAKLAQLYQWRWQVELDLRHVKTTLAMEMLRAKTPEMVRKEIYVTLMAYNLLRTLMWQSAKHKGICAMRISLQCTRQHLRHFIPSLATAGQKKQRKLYEQLLEVISDKLLPDRPYRYEPRVKKRRPKSYGWMKEPRCVLKAKLVA